LPTTLGPGLAFQKNAGASADYSVIIGKNYPNQLWFIGHRAHLQPKVYQCLVRYGRTPSQFGF
jgi:hypothetical protein